MPDGDVLRIQSIVDLAPITQGVPAAAATVEASTNRMAVGFQKVAATSAEADAATKKVSQSFQQQSGQASELEAQLKMLQAQYQQLQAEQERLIGLLPMAGTKMTGEFTEARHAIMGVGEEIGVRLPRFVTTFLAHLEGVAPMMAAAFSAVAVIGLIMVIPELIGKIKEAAEAMAGWDAEAKKTYNDLLEANRQLYLEVLKTNAAHRELTEVGTTGALKLANHEQAVKASMHEVNQAIIQTIHSQHEAQMEVDRTHKSWKGLFDLHTYAVALWMTDEDEINNRLKGQRQTLEELTKQLREYRDQLQFKDPAEAAAEQRSRVLAMAQAQSDAARKLNSDSVSFQEQTIKQMFALGQISREQEIAALQSAEEQKYQIELRYINQRKALAVQKEKTQGEPAGPELAKLNAETESLELGHQTRMFTIKSQGALEEQAAQNAADLATVAGARKVADAQVQLAEQTARQLRAARKISLDEETNDLKDAETKRYNAEVATLTKQMEIAKQFPEKNKAQIITLQADLDAAEVEHQSRLTEIDTQATEQRLNEVRREMQEKLRYAQESANIQLQMAVESANMQLKAHSVGLEQWRTVSLNAVNNWYQEQHAVLQKELEDARTTYGEQSVEYKRMIDKMNLLDQERLHRVQSINDQVNQRYTQMFQNISETMASHMGRWMAGWEKTGEMWRGLWESMTTAFMQNTLKMIAQELVAAALHKSLAKQQILGEAGHAAAITFRKVMAALPFPANVVVAPIAAAGAFATVMTFGKFERGGISEHGGPALLHPKEMVLPRNISEPLQGMLADHASTANRALPIALQRTGTPNVGAGTMSVGTGSTLGVPSIIAPQLAASSSIRSLHGEGEPGGSARSGGSGLMGSMFNDPATALSLRRLISAGVGDASASRGPARAHVTYAPTVHNGPADMEDMLQNHSATIRRIVQDEMRNGGLALPI